MADGEDTVKTDIPVSPNQSEEAIDWHPVEGSPQKRQALQLVNLDSDDEDVEMVDKFTLDRRGGISSGSGTSDSDPDTSDSSGDEKIGKVDDKESISESSTEKKTEEACKKANEGMISSPSTSDSSSESSSDEEKEKEVQEVKRPTHKIAAAIKMNISDSSSESSSDEDEEKEVKEGTQKMTTDEANKFKITEVTMNKSDGSMEEKELVKYPETDESKVYEAVCSTSIVCKTEPTEEGPHYLSNAFISLVSYETTSSEEEDEEGETQTTAVHEGRRNCGNAPVRIIPIKAPGELTVEDLPPIEELSLEVSEETELRLIGRVSSIVDCLVVIQCLPGAPGLADDSLLFREDRRSIGKVFELFGPVIAPFCSVRFNSAEMAKNSGIAVGMSVFFAPQRPDLSRIVLPARLESRGSDASWKNDVEPPSQFLDYSDDETERREKRKARGRPTNEADTEGDEETGDGSDRKRSAPKRKDRRSKPEVSPWQSSPGPSNYSPMTTGPPNFSPRIPGPPNFPPRTPGPPNFSPRTPGPSNFLPRTPGPPNFPSMASPRMPLPSLPPIDLSMPPPGWNGPLIPPMPVATPPRHPAGNSPGFQIRSPSVSQNSTPNGNESHFDQYFDHYYRYYQQYYQQYYQSQNP